MAKWNSHRVTRVEEDASQAGSKCMVHALDS